MWNKLTSVVAEKVYDLDTLRQPAFSDKDRSKTRMIFTLVLFGGAIACFIILFVYKAANRASVIKTEDNPTYLALNSSFSSTLTCTAKTAVNYLDFTTGATPNDIYETHISKCEPPNYKYEQYAACEGGAYLTVQNLQNLQIPKGFILSPLEISEMILSVVVNSPQSLNNVMYTAFFSIYKGIEDLVESDNLAGNETNIEERYQQLINDIYGSDDTTTPYFNILTEDFMEGIFDDNGPKISYEAYYKAARVGTCTYTSREGWFDVFIFAVNSTQSLFSATVIILGFLYGAAKSYQGSRKEKEEGGVELAAVKQEEELEKPKQQEERPKTDDSSSKRESEEP